MSEKLSHKHENMQGKKRPRKKGVSQASGSKMKKAKVVSVGTDFGERYIEQRDKELSEYTVVFLGYLFCGCGAVP